MRGCIGPCFQTVCVWLWFAGVVLVRVDGVIVFMVVFVACMWSLIVCMRCWHKHIVGGEPRSGVVDALISWL